MICTVSVFGFWMWGIEHILMASIVFIGTVSVAEPQLETGMVSVTNPVAGSMH